MTIKIDENFRAFDDVNCKHCDQPIEHGTNFVEMDDYTCLHALCALDVSTKMLESAVRVIRGDV